MTPQPHCKYLLIEEQEFEYLTNQMENDHVIKIYEDVRGRIRCCNCGVPKQADGTPNCPDECVFSDQYDAAIAAQALAPIREVYERFARLDKILSAKDPDCPMMQSYSEIWVAVRDTVRKQEAQR